MTYDEAKKLAEKAAPLLYHGSALVLLQFLVKKAYKGKKFADDITQPVTRTKQTLRRAIGVEERQLYNVLDTLKDVVAYDGHDNKITYTLNLEPLTKLDPEAIEAEKEKRIRDSRTARAREKRAENRGNAKNALAVMIAAGVASGMVPEKIFAVAA